MDDHPCALAIATEKIDFIDNCHYEKLFQSGGRAFEYLADIS